MIPLLFTILLAQATYLDLYRDARSYLDAGEIMKARSALVQSASLNPGHIPTLKTLAEVYVKLKQFPKAIDYYQRLIELNPRDIKAREHLAELYSWVGNHDKAIVTYQDALAIDPQNLGLKTGLAKVFRWTKRYYEAEELYTQALQADPDHHEALKGIAKTYAMMGNFADALKVLEKAIDLHPNNAELYKEKGTVLAWQKNYRKAIKALQKAVELSPDYSDAYRTMGDVHYWMESYKESAEQYERAVEIEPDNAKSRVMLARAYIATGENRRAEDHLRIALGINPLDKEAIDLLNKIKKSPFISLYTTIGEVVEFFSYMFVLILVFIAYRRNRKVLIRRHKMYRFFINLILPFSAMLAFAMYIGHNWFNMRLLHDLAESILFFALGLSFISLLYIEYKTKEFKEKVLLAIGAHPDDIELGCSGLLMKARDSGAKIYGLTLTKGEKGIDGAGDRENEQIKAAKFLGFDSFWVLDIPDTQINENLHKVKEVIEEKIKETKATIVLTHTPLDIHRDHKAVFEATTEAARNVATVLSYEDIGTPREFVPNYFIDISGYIKDKIKLINFHRTQGHKMYMDPEVIRGRAAHRGLQSGVQYAEAFRAHRIVQ